MSHFTQPVTAWGRLSRELHHVISLSPQAPFSEQLQTPGLPFGNGRSYGDVCLNSAGYLWHTQALNAILSFNPHTGRLRCEGGTLLGTIQQKVLSHGWLLPVTPGTQWVTVGGAIANDIHGKNHHQYGTFGEHINALTLGRSNGDKIHCSLQENPEWLCATIGGLGLTGLILEVDLQLRPVAGPWLQTETLPFFSLDEFFHLNKTSETHWDYTVAWLDLLSSQQRGLFMRANHVAPHQPPPFSFQKTTTVPFDLPFSLINRWSSRYFNRYYFTKQQRTPASKLQSYESFLYPLDPLHHWNKLYGPKGFFQYQCVLPDNTGPDALQALFSLIRRERQGSCLTTLKTFSQRPPLGMLSFPLSGVTLAVDFPNKGLQTLNCFSQLDTVVAEAGGRLYPAKDARMPRALFQAGYPRLQEFLTYRDPGIQSGFSRRVIDKTG